VATQYVFEVFPQALAAPKVLGMADAKEIASVGNLLLLLGKA